jgi:superfamily I DNA and/or RNA helicase
LLIPYTDRLPKPICNIISTEVYNRSLIPNSTEQRSTCCKWIDVQGEEEVDGTSYKVGGKNIQQAWISIPIQNEKEIDACILLAKELESKGKDYRIISPYAPQTTQILARLKEENMNWEDKCFNVDSFQGNEADYIIISLVRTASMGFLDNNRRANVLLTRCKKGMYVVCSRELMLGERASGTLLGKFAFSWTSSQVRFMKLPCL